MLKFYDNPSSQEEELANIMLSFEDQEIKYMQIQKLLIDAYYKGKKDGIDDAVCIYNK